MIDEVAKALKAYRGLGTLGKRLFRDETGLQRPQAVKRRTARRATKVTTSASAAGADTSPA